MDRPQMVPSSVDAVLNDFFHMGFRVGKSLNMTAMSILGALVIWTGIWGIPGAVLSVPLLGIQKILMVYTNHPFAKYMLLLIRA